MERKKPFCITKSIKMTLSNTKQKVFILVFFVLFCLQYNIIYRRANSSIWVEDSQKELSETLDRQEKGRAAVVIIKVDDFDEEGKSWYLFQRKSADYPIPIFRKALCIIGGNAESSDDKPLQTLSRELGEELPSSLVDSILKSPTLSYFGTFQNSHTAKLVQKPNPYTFLCACYIVTISKNDIPSEWINSDNNEEGSYELVQEDDLLKNETFAFGFDSVFSWYIGKDVSHFVEGADVTKRSDNDLSEWTTFLQ